MEENILRTTVKLKDGQEAWVETKTVLIDGQKYQETTGDCPICHQFPCKHTTEEMSKNAERFYSEHHRT